MIRASTTADDDAILEVWRRSSRVAHAFLDDGFFIREEQEIRERWLPIAETSVFEHDGLVVGFLSLIGDEVGAFFVDPEYQGRGIGRLLMDNARSSRARLVLDVFEANSSGRRFYDSYGFEALTTKLHEVTGQPVLRLELDRER